MVYHRLICFFFVESNRLHLKKKILTYEDLSDSNDNWSLFMLLEKIPYFLKRYVGFLFFFK